jgi:hypothetical protein
MLVVEHLEREALDDAGLAAARRDCVWDRNSGHCAPLFAEGGIPREGTLRLDQCGVSAGIDEAPAPQSKPVTRASDLVAQIAPLVAFELGLRILAAGPARIDCTPLAGINVNSVATDPRGLRRLPQVAGSAGENEAATVGGQRVRVALDCVSGTRTGAVIGVMRCFEGAKLAPTRSLPPLTGAVMSRP